MRPTAATRCVSQKTTATKSESSRKRHVEKGDGQRRQDELVLAPFELLANLDAQERAANAGGFAQRRADGAQGAEQSARDGGVGRADAHGGVSDARSSGPR